MTNLQITEQLPLRSLVLVLISILGLTVTAGYLYVIKKPAAALELSSDELFNLRRAHPVGEPFDDRIAAAAQDVAALQSILHGTAPALASNEMVAFVIGRLDNLARKQNVQLLSVEPGDVTQVFEFDEIPFHIEIVGSYFHLVDWLRNAEQELGPMVIKTFDIAPAGAGENRRMRLTMVSYRHTGDDV